MAFQGLLPQFTEKGVAIVGCSNDDAAKNAAFAQENGFDFPLLCDTDLAVSVAYGAAADGSAKSASRVAALIGGDDTLLQFWSPAGTADFPAKVLAAV